jgi:gliding motility-associated-like protein
MNILDNNSFCFSFEVRDTVSPTYLTASVSVIRVNGQSFSGTLPTLSYTTQTDSLLQGTICWQIPCELANESFYLKITASDTFDCRSSNTIFDSVRVNHIDQIPQAVDICRVTVTASDAGIEAAWNPSLSSDVVGYLVARKRSDQANFQVLDTIWNPGVVSYLDATALVDDFSYCYAVAPIDNCGNSPAFSSAHCTVLLAGTPQDYATFLDWSAYIGWLSGVQEYEIYRRNALPNNPYNLIAVPISPDLSATDGSISDGRVCYRVRALEANANCGGDSWSNEVCVEFPPLMFMPNAFTPNGDQLNDIFTAGGLYFESFDLQIWDRWGKLLFHTQNSATGWDGKVGGKDAPEGVYVFQVVVRGYDGTELKQNGSLTLIR